MKFLSTVEDCPPFEVVWDTMCVVTNTNLVRKHCFRVHVLAMRTRRWHSTVAWCCASVFVMKSSPSWFSARTISTNSLTTSNYQLLTSRRMRFPLSRHEDYWCIMWGQADSVCGTIILVALCIVPICSSVTVFWQSCISTEKLWLWFIRYYGFFSVIIMKELKMNGTGSNQPCHNSKDSQVAAAVNSSWNTFMSND